jgi:hypothetical protein
LFEFRRGDPRRLVPSMVTMAELDVDVARAGGAEKAKELMQSLTARLEQGEDIVKLGAELETAKIGTLNPWEPRELGPMQQSELFAEFTREPKVGKVSAPLPLRPRGELEGYALLQILKLEIPDAPLFESGEIQQRLRSRVETRQQALRRERELTKLLGAAYVWPPEAFGRESAAPEGDD